MEAITETFLVNGDFRLILPFLFFAQPEELILL